MKNNLTSITVALVVLVGLALLGYSTRKLAETIAGLGRTFERQVEDRIRTLEELE